MDQSPWPLRDLRITTPQLELRFVTDSDLQALVKAAASEGYDPSVPAFAVKEDTPVQRSRRLMQRLWAEWGSWKPSGWGLSLAAVVEGETVGHQIVGTREFAVTREVITGSWVVKARQGEGIGTRMRLAVLHFVFAGLGATYAISSARLDNAASIGVSRKVGYLEDGLEQVTADGEALMLQRFRLDSERWASLAQTDDSYEIHGREPCRELFGL